MPLPRDNPHPMPYGILLTTVIWRLKRNTSRVLFRGDLQFKWLVKRRIERLLDDLSLLSGGSVEDVSRLQFDDDVGIAESCTTEKITSRRSQSLVRRCYGANSRNERTAIIFLTPFSKSNKFSPTGLPLDYVHDIEPCLRRCKTILCTCTGLQTITTRPAPAAHLFTVSFAFFSWVILSAV